jgi:hypothetical protein
MPGDPGLGGSLRAAGPAFSSSSSSCCPAGRIPTHATRFWRRPPEGFGGVLGWGRVDNRPFLRCLHGLTVSTWRLEQYIEAQELCWALL